MRFSDFSNTGFVALLTLWISKNTFSVHLNDSHSTRIRNVYNMQKPIKWILYSMSHKVEYNAGHSVLGILLYPIFWKSKRYSDSLRLWPVCSQKNRSIYTVNESDNWNLTLLYGLLTVSNASHLQFGKTYYNSVTELLCNLLKICKKTLWLEIQVNI